MAEPQQNGPGCSFCGSLDDVALIITGPAVNICDECIEICNGVLLKHYRKTYSQYEKLKKARVLHYSEICG